MESSFESKTGTIQRSDREIFDFLSNFTHFSSFIPADKIQDWEATPEQCSFQVDVVGKILFRLVEKEPSKTIKVAIESTFAQNVFLWVQLKASNPGETKAKLTLKADMNPMIKMMVGGRVKEFLDKLIDALSSMN